MSARNLFAWLSVGLIVMIVLMAALGTPGGATASAASTREIKMTAAEFSFVPPELTLTHGEKIKITLTNGGGLEHTLVLVDATNKPLSPKLSTNSGQTKSVQFEAPAAGSYQIICDVAGHKEQGMLTKVTVK